MPAADATAPPDRPADAPLRRRPDRDAVRSAAREALGRGSDRLPSQAALRRALLPILKEIDPAFVLSNRRMRSMLLGAPGLRVRVRYRETSDRAPLSACPVCSSALEAIHNRTLEGDRVTLGYRCSRCAYWTHLRRRVPVRYAFLRSGRARPRDESETAEAAARRPPTRRSA